MSKTVEIRKAVYGLLSEVYSGCYYRKAPADAQMPYVVYSIGNYGPAAYLKLDIWDNATDSTAVENLADQFETALHRLTFSNSELMVSFLFERDRQQLPDEDRSLTHLVENFSMKYYGKEEI